MKYLKLLFLPLLFGCALAQQTPINNPVLTGTISIPAVTNNLTYVNSSHQLVTLGLGSGLTLSGGVLTSNNSGGGGGSAGVFTTLQVGSDAATSAQPIDFTPVVTASSSSAKEMRVSGTLTNVANNDALYGIASGGIITSNSAYTNVSFTHLLLGTTSTSGSLSLANATELYINAAPQTGGTTTYGIVQAGTGDINTFAGPTTFGGNLTVNGISYLNGTSYLPLATFVGSGSSPAITFGDTSTLTSSGFTFNKIAQFNASSGYVANFSGPTYFGNNQYYNPSLFSSTLGGILGVNGATGKVAPVTLVGLYWNGTNTLSTTNGGAYVNVTGTPSQSFPSGTETSVNWNNVVYDDYGTSWSSATPSYIYVPSGASYIRLSVTLNLANSGSGNRQIKIKDSNGNNYAGNCDTSDSSFASNYISATTGLIKLSAQGNPTWFQVTLIQDTGLSISLFNGAGGFSLEVVK